MGLSRSEMAVETYQLLMDSASGALLDEARWYLALSYLKREMVFEAIALLEDISVSGSSHRYESRKILRTIR